MVDGSNIVVLIVVHHVVADGLRGVAHIASLLDDRPGVTLDEEPRAFAPPPTSYALIGDNLRGQLKRFLAFVRGLPELPARTRALVRSSREAMNEMKGYVALSLAAFSYAGRLSIALHLDGGVPAADELRASVAASRHRGSSAFQSAIQRRRDRSSTALDTVDAGHD